MLLCAYIGEGGSMQSALHLKWKVVRFLTVLSPGGVGSPTARHATHFNQNCLQIPTAALKNISPSVLSTCNVDCSLHSTDVHLICRVDFVHTTMQLYERQTLHCSSSCASHSLFGVRLQFMNVQTFKIHFTKVKQK